MAAPPQSLPPPFPSGEYAPSGHYDQKSLSMSANGQGMPSAPMGGSTQMAAQSTQREKDGKRYALLVEQQPVRARMCGFGDKDRRPITPPPCIRLVITDLKTGREVPADSIDPTFFVLQVDLWDEAGLHEKNVVRAASNSPATSISTATTTSYPPPLDRMYTGPSPMAQVYPQHSYGSQMMVSAQPQNPYAQPQMYPQPQTLPSMYPQNPQAGYYAQQMPQAPYPGYPAPQPPNVAPVGFQQYPPTVMAPQQSQTGMFTRNLIGSLTVNAFTLRDTTGKEGHWFILQDLSVRTEGSFRLKMNFVDVGAAMGPEKPGLNRGTAPVLASVFSQPFQVFSAKKFPGVIESTELSKTFAGQGIKIPIRKDGGKSEHKDEDDD